MPGGQPLRVVLRAAQRVQVQRFRHRIGQRHLDDLGGDAAQPQPLAQHHGVAAVAVGAHHVGQHQPDPHCVSQPWRANFRCSCRNAV